MDELVEASHRSKLTFVTSRESTDRVEVEQLRRGREPVSRSRSGVQGKVADVASGHRKRHARFMEDHASATVSEVASAELVGDSPPDRPKTQSHHSDGTGGRQQPAARASSTPDRPVVEPEAFTDDESLPVFETSFDLPHGSVAAAIVERDPPA